MSESKRVIFRGRKVELHELDVSVGDGQVVKRELVKHPGSVVLLPLLGDGRIVLIRNLRYTVGRELLELPAGTLEPPEDPSECARRELREETGYEAQAIEAMGRFYSTPGFCNEQLFAFRATGLRQVGQALDPGERIRLEVLGEARVREMLLGGEIHDAKTIAVLGLYFLRKGE